MKIFNKNKTPEKRQILVNNVNYGINIFIENRKNSRVSITKTGINIRVPFFLKEKEKIKQINKFIDWAKKTIEEKGVTFIKNQREFKNKDVLKLYDKTVEINIIETNSNIVKGRIDNEKIQIEISSNLKKKDRNVYLSKIISSLISKNYKNKISLKLLEKNEKHQFGKINEIRLKNNKTNWGSCSSKNNINISIRLLLAPEWVVDYVLIHELSHLVHRNHSSNFWKLVENCCPEYKKAEKWLKKNSSKCII